MEFILMCVCVYIFNGRRPVPITRVPPIPCWDKGRQVVRPGCWVSIDIYTIAIDMEKVGTTAHFHSCRGQRSWTIVRIFSGRDLKDTPYELRETQWAKPQKHHVWGGQLA